MTEPNQQSFDTERLFALSHYGKMGQFFADRIGTRPLPALFVWGTFISLPVCCAVLIWFSSFVKEPNSAFFIPAMLAIYAILGAFLSGLIKIIKRPTHLGIGANGIRLHWNRTFQFSGKPLVWQDLTGVYLIHQRKKPTSGQRLICLASSVKTIEVPVFDADDKDFLAFLCESVATFAPQITVDPQLTHLISSQHSQNSYTELWLNALTANPERGRMTQLESGSTLKAGEYIILEQIGSGGQGVAYKARQQKTGTLVALKEYVLPAVDDKNARSIAIHKLQQEAELLHNIHCPQIVSMLDCFFEDHRGYLVLEMVAGIPLNQLVKNSGPLPEAQCAEIARQLCDILAYLHSKDPAIIHRDFTPDNLIYSEESGLVKLIDFNVAQHESHTVTATIVGKHSYIAPEQFRGRATNQSDLYSLGATVYFLLTGTEPKPISESNPKSAVQDLTEAMNKFVSACTAIDLTARVRSAAEAKILLTE